MWGPEEPGPRYLSQYLKEFVSIASYLGARPPNIEHHANITASSIAEGRGVWINLG